MRNSPRGFLWDLAGAFGDVGVLFPLAIALVNRNGFNPTALFLTAGAFYLASAFYFRITMPVQPLKAMAAIAIASGMGAETVSAAGISMGLILLLLALTGWSVRLGSIFPISVIRGIQFGLGLILIRSAGTLIQADLSGAVLGTVVLALALLARNHFPPLIPVLLAGAVLAARHLWANPSPLSGMGLGPETLSLHIPSLAQLWAGLSILVLPQIALTFGNAIVATENTAKLLYGKRADRLNLRSIPFSMGIANVFTGLLGGVPMCHGCGGLTAHAKFGATSERSGLLIGAFLLLLALLFGRTSVALISAFPQGILGILLFSVGVLHAWFIHDIVRDRKATAVALLTGIAGFALNNLSLGFLFGICVHFGLRLRRR